MRTIKETYKNFYIKTSLFIKEIEYKRVWLHRVMSCVGAHRTLEPGVTENVRHSRGAILFLDTILFIGFRLQYYTRVILRHKIGCRENGSPVKSEKCINITEYKDSNNIYVKDIDCEKTFEAEKLNEFRGKTQSHLCKSLITRLVYFWQVITPALSLFRLDIIYNFREPLFYHGNYFIHGEDWRY